MLQVRRRSPEVQDTSREPSQARGAGRRALPSRRFAQVRVPNAAIAILSAALDEFSAPRLPSPPRLDDVARRAGVAKGTIYLYFRDKESLGSRNSSGPC